MNEIKEYTEKIFEDIKHIDNEGTEYWFARELQTILKYSQWRRFENAIEKAKIACNNSKIKFCQRRQNDKNSKRMTKKSIRL